MKKTFSLKGHREPNRNFERPSEVYVEEGKTCASQQYQSYCTHLEDVKVDLEFAQGHLKVPSTNWKKVLCSDETNVKLFGTNTGISSNNTIPTVKHGGGSITL